MTKEICKLPSFFSTVLFKKIDSSSTGFVTRYLGILAVGLFLNVGDCDLKVCNCMSTCTGNCNLFSVNFIKFLRLSSYVVPNCDRDAFVDYWINKNMLTMDIATQIYAILKQPDLKYLTQVFFFFGTFIFLCSIFLYSISVCYQRLLSVKISKPVNYCCQG